MEEKSSDPNIALTEEEYKIALAAYRQNYLNAIISVEYWKGAIETTKKKIEELKDEVDTVVDEVSNAN